MRALGGGWKLRKAAAVVEQKREVAAKKEGVDLILTKLDAIRRAMQVRPRTAAALPMENPYCGCGL